MTRVLHIAKDLSLPVEAITSRIGFTGQSESGKTYAATKLAEEMIGVGAQIIAIDPVGPWYGLKMGKDRHTPGLPVVVFGGVHADLPLLPDSGRIVAEVLAEKRFSAVLDVSEFTMGELSKFTAAFAEHFFDAKKRNKSPVTIFWEEAQSFAPQELPPDPHSALMLNRVVRVVKVGRNYGIGNVLVTQEPQAVSKRALSQVNCLFMGYMQGDKPRAAVKAWVSDRAKSAADIDLVAELPKLKTGEMFAAEPKWFGPIRKVHIAEKRTFDSSMTPKLGEDAPEPGKLAAVDLRELRAALANEVEQAKADDPKELRRQIADLRAQLGRSGGQWEAVAQEAMAEVDRLKKLKVPKAEIREKPVLKDGQLARVEALVDKKLKVDDAVAAALRELAAVIRPTIPATAFENQPGQPQLGPPPAPKISGRFVKPPPPPIDPKVHHHMPLEEPQTTGDLPKGERVVLTAVAQHPEGATREQISVLTTYKRSSRDKFLQGLSAAGHVEESGGRIFATKSGIGALGANFQPLPTGPALLEHWRRELPEGERVVLDAVISFYPGATERSAIDEITNYKRSSRDKFIQHLLSRRLLTEPGRGQVRASEHLFG